MNRQRQGLGDMIVPLVLDSLSGMAPQRRTLFKQGQVASHDPTVEAIKLIGLGVLSLAIGIAVLSSSRDSPPPD